MLRKYGYRITPMGGLGNQLFIYATGKALAARSNSTLTIDARWYAMSDEREFGLRDFEIQDHVISPRAPGKLLLHSKRLRRRLPRNSWIQKTYFETSYGFDSSVLALPQGTALEGYFQSWKYFEDYQCKLRETIPRLVSPSPWYLAKKRELGGMSESWIGLHVRRGDYLNETNSKLFGVLGREYYETSIGDLFKSDREQRLVIFSEDPREAREFLADLAEDAEFIESPPESSALESLLLLAEAPSIVCANSSFSWWAAYLGEREGQQVVVPARWFAGRDFDQEDLFRAHWKVSEAR